MSNQKKTVGKVILIVLCILLSLVLVGLIAAYIYMDTMLDKINRYPSQQETLSSSQIAIRGFIICISSSRNNIISSISSIGRMPSFFPIV